MVELITELLEFERNTYWRTGQRLKCHSGRYRSVGCIVVRICTGRIVATVERVGSADSEHLFYKRASVP